MAKFGWAYLDCSSAESGSAGPSGSLQFSYADTGQTTGSAYLTYYSASVLGYDPSSLILSGNFIATGSATIEANLSVTGALNLNGIMANATTISADVTIPADYNAVIYGPITIAAGKTITVSDGANFKIKDFADV